MIRKIFMLAILSLAAGVPAGAQTGGNYGGRITLEQITPLSELYANPAVHSGKEVLVSGRVLSVCQEKGCWLALDAGGGNELIIRFKDYAFFVPKDIAGSRASIQGIFTAEVDPGHQHDHGDEEEHGCPTGEFTFIASAVHII